MYLILEPMCFNLHLSCRLKDEKNVHNPSYDETQRFSNSLSIKASSSKNDEYSEISENNVSFGKSIKTLKCYKY